MDMIQQEETVVNEIFPDAYRAGLITRDGSPYIALEFGKALAMVDTGDEKDVEPLVRVAIIPEDLKILFERIVQIGVRYSPDFWNDYNAVEDEDE